MGDRKWKLCLSDTAKKEQKKYFCLCSKSDHNKLIGKEPMTVEDFGRITYLLKVLGLEEYELYVTMKFEKQLTTYVGIQEWLDAGDYSLDEERYGVEVEQAEQWLKAFCMQIPHERTRRKYIERYLE